MTMAPPVFPVQVDFNITHLPNAIQFDCRFEEIRPGSPVPAARRTNFQASARLRQPITILHMLKGPDLLNFAFQYLQWPIRTLQFGYVIRDVECFHPQNLTVL